jgi:hypothetical protein
MMAQLDAKGFSFLTTATSQQSPTKLVPGSRWKGCIAEGEINSASNGRKGSHFDRHLFNACLYGEKSGPAAIHEAPWKHLVGRRQTTRTSVRVEGADGILRS